MKATLYKDEKFEISKLIEKIIANKWLVAASLLFFVFLASLYNTFSTREYMVKSSFLVEEREQGKTQPSELSMSRGDLPEMLQVGNNLENELKILKSRNLAEQVVDALQLNVKIYAKSGLKLTEVFYEAPFQVTIKDIKGPLKSRAYDVKLLDDGTINITNSDEALDKNIKLGNTIRLSQYKLATYRHNCNCEVSTHYVIEIESKDHTVSNLMSRLTAEFTDESATIIDLTLSYPHPKKGEAILRTLQDLYILNDRESKIALADKTVAFIDDRLANVGEELTDVEKNLEGYRSDNNIADLTEQSKVLIGDASDYSKKYQEQSMQLSVINSLEDLLKNSNENKVIPSSLTINNASFAATLQRYNELLLESEKQSLASTEINPVVENLNKQIETTRATLLQSIGAYKKEIESNIALLANQNNSFSNQIQEMPGKERVFLQYARQQNLKQELYLYLLQKREEMAIAKTSNIINSRVIDPPKSELKPFKPNRPIVLLLGFFTGLIFPVSIILSKDFLSTRIRSKNDIIKNTEVPILGEIIHNSSTTDIVLGSEFHTRIAEQFRTLRTNLLSFNGGKTLLVTSSTASEGKTFVAINIAISLALSGNRVLLLDFDLRKPSILEKFDLNNHDYPGISNYLTNNKLNLQELVIKLRRYEHLDILPTGLLPGNPSEILMGKRVSALISEAAAYYDYIVIDTPPVGEVSDAYLLRQYTDLCLYVVRNNKTQIEHLEIVEEIREKQKMKDVALIYNEALLTKGYGYVYGYVDSTKDNKKKLLNM